MNKLQDRVAIVTGGGQGIGEAIARAFVAAGAKVAVVDVQLANAEKVAASLGDSAMACACDVSDRAQVDATVAAVNQRWGRVDILVNNAGITRPAMLHKMTMEQWHLVLRVHLDGSFYFLQAVSTGMIARKYGRVINVTSTAGLLGTIGQANYSAAKAAIVGLTMSGAKELGRHGITVNAVAPAAATPMTETIRTDERFKEKYLERIPLGRWAEPAEIAPVFVFLASDDASYVTGQVLAADGGLTIR